MLGVGEEGTGRASPLAGAQGTAEPRAGTSRPLPSAPQPPIYQKAINSLPPTQVLRFLSLPTDCRAVIRVCLMRFSWRGYGLSMYLPIRQRLCHRLWCGRKFFSGCFHRDTSQRGTRASPGTAGLRDLLGSTREVALRHVNPIIFIFFFFSPPHSTKIKKPSIS